MIGAAACVVFLLASSVVFFFGALVLTSGMFHHTSADARIIIDRSWATIGAGSILGLSAAVYGGYAAALVAGKDEVQYGAASNLLVVAFGLLGVFHGHHGEVQFPPLLRWTLDIGGLLFGAFGGWLRLREKAEEASPPRLLEVSRWLCALPAAEIAFMFGLVFCLVAGKFFGASALFRFMMGTALGTVFGVGVGALCAAPRYRVAATVLCFGWFVALPLLQCVQAVTEGGPAGLCLLAAAGVVLGGSVLRRSLLPLWRIQAARLQGAAPQ